MNIVGEILACFQALSSMDQCVLTENGPPQWHFQKPLLGKEFLEFKDDQGTETGRHPGVGTVTGFDAPAPNQ